MTAADRQMLLFTDLPIPTAPTASPSRRRVLAAVAAAFLGEQLAFRFTLRELERDDQPEPGPVHRLVKAADAEPLKVIPVASIFGLADTFKALKRGRFGARAQPRDTPAPAVGEPAPYRVERSYADGVHRVIRQRPEETAEWQEKERARRAKQRPPKPTRKAKTRSKKLLELIGEPDD
ncbi:hypothetical protein UFOVP726_16 [uncultured Caudovirales phage]|uniref:Uncharacterized protein n=1 Tax=uncultured Caudovirales phage TaxID=2100421 RepID=A0A6J5NLI5_9CAUD|nr:hypothetical protein UFOVP726_16 [uncultured Caudovirales phage]